MPLPITTPKPAGEPARRDYRLLRRLLLAALVVGCARYVSLNMADPDLWGHTLYGQEWLADGVLPQTATHTYTAEGHRWINHENLAELALAIGFGSLGVPGMLAAKCLVGMVVLGLMAIVARRHGVGVLTTWVWLLLVAANLQVFVLLRPQLLSFLWCAVALYVLDHAFAGWGNRRADFRERRRQADRPAVDWRWLVALPPLVALWTNSHGGFVAGLAIVLTFLGGRAVEAVFRPGIAARRHTLGLLAVMAGCVAATLLNPYGLQLHRWLLASLGAPRPEITEWDPPSPSTPLFWPFVTLAAAAVAALAVSKKRRDPVRVLILILVAWQAASHLRHIAFFALLCGFWLPPHLQSAIDRLRVRAVGKMPTISPSAAQRSVLVAALSVIIALQVVSLGGRLSSLPVLRSHYPVDALQWMAERGVRGKLVVSFNWAQYAIAALEPDVRVSCDGRFRTCYPQEAVDRHFDFLLGEERARWRRPEAGEVCGARELEHGRPDYVLLDRRYPNPRRVMEESAGDEWVLVYQDRLAQVWGRSEAVDDKGSPAWIAPELRFVSDHISTTSVEWPALPRRVSSESAPPREVAERETQKTVGDG